MTKKKTPIKQNLIGILLLCLIILGCIIIILIHPVKNEISIGRNGITADQAFEIVKSRYPEVTIWILTSKDRSYLISNEEGGWYMEFPGGNGIYGPDPNAFGRYFVDPKTGNSKRVCIKIFGKTFFPKN